MNGGAWLTVDGEKVALLSRDLGDVERWTAQAEQGTGHEPRMPPPAGGYLAIWEQ